MKPKFMSQSLKLTVISFTLSAPFAYAGQIWDGGGTNNNWTSPANWDGNISPNWTLAGGITFVGETRTSTLNSLTADTIVAGINFTNDGSTGKTAAFSLTQNRLTLGGNIVTTASSSTITDSIGLDMILNAARSINTGANHNLTISGIISQDATNRNLSKLGVGILTLSNTANTFAGQFLSDAGMVRVTKLADNGSASSLGSGISPIRLGSNATATLEYIGTTDSSANKVIQIGTNTATNTGNAAILNNGSGKLTFTAANFNSDSGGAITVARSLTLGGSYTGAANEIQGIIRDHNTVGGGTVSLSKEGASTWTLSGVNTYTGATNVNAGVLAVNGSLAITATTVGNGGTLQGSGSIGGSVTVLGGGTLAAGNSIESLATGALTLEALANFEYEINSDAAPGVAGDLTSVTGNLAIDMGNAAILTLGELGSGSWSIGEKLTLISYSGLWNGGLFRYNGSTLADDSVITFSGMDWLFNYNDTAAGTNYTSDLTGTRFMTMTAIPEPSAALLGGFGLLAFLRRRR